jgi:hypothetical protein
MKKMIRGMGILALLAVPGFGATLTFNLDCVLSNGACTEFAQSFGTVTITDISDGVDVTVNTAHGGKYKDLFLNLTGEIDLDSPAEFAANGFTLNPYSGLYDVGTSTQPSKGFDGNNGGTFQILGSGLTAASFNAFDSLGFTQVGIHLQQIDCTDTSCVFGNGSIKVGGRLMLDDPPSDDPGVPEPSTYAIVGGGLAAIYWMRRKRAQA